MAAAHAGSGGDASPDASDPSIHSSSLGDQRSAGSFAQGMYVSLWPKIERCHNYVAVLLAAQEQLQETVDQLIAGLKEAEEAEASSLVGYADRLKNFPSRVEKLQRKLELIEDRLLALKEARNRGASCISKYNPEDPAAHHMTSPLF